MVVLVAVLPSRLALAGCVRPGVEAVIFVHLP